MGIRERKAKNGGRKLHNLEIRDLNTPQVLLGDKMNKDENKRGDVPRMKENRGFAWELSRKEIT